MRSLFRNGSYLPFRVATLCPHGTEYLICCSACVANMIKEAIGTIQEVQGPVVTVSCTVLPPIHRAIETRTDDDTLCAGSLSACRRKQSSCNRSSSCHWPQTWTAGLRLGRTNSCTSNARLFRSYTRYFWSSAGRWYGTHS